MEFYYKHNQRRRLYKNQKNICNKETTASKFQKRKYKLLPDIPEGFEIETNSSTNGDIMVIWSNENAKFDLISWKVENEENGIKAISWHDTDSDNEILSNTLKKRRNWQKLPKVFIINKHMIFLLLEIKNCKNLKIFATKSAFYT